MNGAGNGHRTLPRINLEIDGREVLAVIDTAATETFVSPRVLPPEADIGSAGRRVNLAADGVAMDILGRVELTVRIQKRPFKISALVAPGLRETLLLGLPWLRAEDGILDFTRNVLYIGGTERITAPICGAPPPADRRPSPQALQLEHGFPAQYEADFRRIIHTHYGVFAPIGGGLPQTKTVMH